MPVVGKAVDGGVFAHGGDGDAVGQSEAAELERGEEVVGWLGHSFWMWLKGRWIWREGLEWRITIFPWGLWRFLGGFLGKPDIFCGFFVVKLWWNAW